MMFNLEKMAAMAKVQAAAENEENVKSDDISQTAAEVATAATEEDDIYIPIEDDENDIDIEPIPDGMPIHEDVDRGGIAKMEEQLNRCFPDEKAYNLELERLLNYRTSITDISVENNDTLKKEISRLGITEPLLVRSVGNGEYEIISGNRRKAAAESLNWTKIPCRIADNDELTQELADKLTVYCNRHSFAAWKPTVQVKAVNLFSDLYTDEVADIFNIPKQQALQFSKLSKLHTSLLSMIDNKAIPLQAAAIAADLSEKEQKLLGSVLKKQSMKLNMAAALELISAGSLTEKAVIDILTPNQPVTVSVSADIAAYFSGMNDEEVTELIETLLTEHFKR